VGQVTDGLDRFFEQGVFLLVEEQSENYRHGKTENEQIEIYQHCVPEEPKKIDAGKKVPEIGQPHPGTSHDPQARTELLECDNCAIEGHVAEEKVKYDHGNRHDINVAIPHQVFPKLSSK
jgi:hypothetical protein